MKHKLLAILALLPALCNVGQAAPVKTGVMINATTRNERASKQTLLLAKNGRALMPIVISPKAGDSTKLAAAELKTYLDRISGATFTIQTGDGRAGLVLGTKAEFPTPSLENALEIAHSFDGKEAYAIRTEKTRLLLLGATDKAVGPAVYRVLEELGCRWFFPNATGNWEVVPKTPRLTWNRDITDRPSFLSRDIWYAWGNFTDSGHPQNTPEHPRNAWGDYRDWVRRSHMGGSFAANTGHAYDTIVAENAKEFAAHPEYFALVGGKRQGNQLETSNPGLRRLVADWAVAYFKKNPDADMVSVDPADGSGTSESPEAKAYGSASEGAFKLANEVARALQTAYPGQNKMVGMYAYNWHSDPPPFALEPNVYIQLTMAFNGGLLSLDQLFDEWPKKARNLGFYDYYSTWRWDGDRWPGGSVANKNHVIGSIRRFQEANARSGAYATSISAESSNNWGVNGRGYYLASKLMWNPDLDAEAVLEDFYAKAFGPAAAAMKKYYGYQDSSPPISPGVVGALFQAMNEARQAAKNRPDVMRRLDDLTTYLHFYDLNYRGGKEMEIWTLAYRSRYSYMNHWEAIRQDWIHEDSAPTTVKPWKVDKPITPEEIEGWLQDGLHHYPELRIPAEIVFSNDLVPVSFGNTAAATSQRYQEGSLYALYSRGEPLHIKLDAGDAYGGLRQTWEVRDAGGKVLQSGKPKPGEKLEFDVPVPSPGVYQFEYHDHGAYGTVYWASGQIAALPLKDRTFRAMSHVNDLYFYVPKGTKTIDYYYKRADWQFGGPHQISDPTGQVVKDVSVDGDYVSVPVPPGTDGKLWKIGGPSFGLGAFRFFTVPNYFSPSPAALLLPREVAQKDNLTVIQ